MCVTFANFFSEYSYGYGLVFLWSHCNTYVLSVLWMMSCLYIMARNMGKEKKMYTQSESTGGSTDLAPRTNVYG